MKKIYFVLLLIVKTILAIDIVFVCDNNYAFMLATSIESILSNKNQNDDINIYVIHPDFEPKIVKNIRQVVRNRASVSFIKFDLEALKNYPKTFHIMGYAKALIPSLLLQINKVLYLDVDTIILGSLKPLWKTSLNDNYVAAAQNQFYEKIIESENRTKYRKRYKNVKLFFNSGVMLLNLKKMREDDIEKKFIYEMENHTHYFGDQPIFNYLFGEKVIYLSPIWNAQSNLFIHKNFDPGHLITPPIELKKAIANPVIVHFSGCHYIDKYHFFHGTFLYFMHKTPWRKLSRIVHEKGLEPMIDKTVDQLNLFEFLWIKISLFWKFIKYMVQIHT